MLQIANITPISVEPCPETGFSAKELLVWFISRPEAERCPAFRIRAFLFSACRLDCGVAGVHLGLYGTVIRKYIFSQKLSGIRRL